MSGLDDDRLTSADFERLFADEPAAGDPAADVRRGRRLRRRRRTGVGAVAVVALVVVGGSLGGVARDGGRLAGPATGPTPVPTAAPTPTSSPSPSPTPSDTAPALRRDADGNYLDRDRQRLGGSLKDLDPGANPFRATTRNSWEVAVRHLDPSRKHLADYEPAAFTGGGGEGIQVGQKLGWTVSGDPGEGMVQLAVTRLEPGADPRLGRAEDAGLCTVDVIQEEGCRRTTIAGVEVYLGTTADGGFVMDHRQADGEVASVIVTPLFANNTEVPLRSMGVTRAAAAELLADPALDVVG